MKIYEVVFSPTGGTRKAADLLAEGLGQDAEVVDIAAPPGTYTDPGFGPEDLAIIAVPSYGGRVPPLAAERISRLRGNGCPAVLVCVYGNRAYDDTLAELQDVCGKAGFRPMAAVAAVAEHSVAREFAPGRPDGADAAQLQKFAAQIRAQMDADETSPLQVPGNVPTKAPSGLSMVPKGGKDCVACGICAEQCPAGAIEPDNPGRSNKDQCISCMRCVVVCPQHARQISPMLARGAKLMLRKACADRKENELFL